MTTEGQSADNDALLHARADALRDFAANVCDRNERYGMTAEARHFGKIYADLARSEAAVIESIVSPPRCAEGCPCGDPCEHGPHEAPIPPEGTDR